jgi:hypothetical protein
LGVVKRIWKLVKENNVKKTIILLILIIFLLSGCSKSVSPPTLVTSTQTLPVPTNTESPTSTPTVTPDPLADAPEGTTGINSAGQWTKTVTENGHKYAYIYNVELTQWVREVSNFPLLDYPYWNFLPYKILITEGTLGERNLYTITHTDNMPGGSNEPTPVMATFGLKLRKRYFQGDTRGLSNIDEQKMIVDEMQGTGESGHQQAYMPVLLSNGEEKLVKLNPDTGITTTIIDKDTLLRLGGDLVSTWNTFEGNTVYSEVYGVDEDGNMLVRFAVDGSIADLSDKDLRNVLFSFPANFVEHKDQREHGLTAFTQVLAMLSARPQPDGAAQDFVIDRIPLAQP